MDIVGIGTDVVECLRIRKLIAGHGETFLRKVFTAREITFCQARRRPAEHFAGRWAAKEAVFRALGGAWKQGPPWTDLEIRYDRRGKPTVRVGGAAKEIVRALGLADILLAIAQCRSYATATALAVRSTGAPPTNPGAPDVPF
jgi:holo-[acyl-carrier protein] synthase